MVFHGNHFGGSCECNQNEERKGTCKCTLTHRAVTVLRKMGRPIKNKTVPAICLLTFKNKTCSFGTNPTNAMWHPLKGREYTVGQDAHCGDVLACLI